MVLLDYPVHKDKSLHHLELLQCLPELLRLRLLVLVVGAVLGRLPVVLRQVKVHLVAVAAAEHRMFGLLALHQQVQLA
jgi:hypothetical protein